MKPATSHEVTETLDEKKLQEYLRLFLAEMESQARGCALDEAAEIADAGVRAAEREIKAAKKKGNKNAEVLGLVARDISAGIAYEIRKLITKDNQDGAAVDNKQREDHMKKKWLRNVETGEKYAVTEDTICVVGMDSNGYMWLGRVPKDRVTVITSKYSPEGTGHMLSPGTDDPEELRRAEAAIVAAIPVVKIAPAP